MGGCVSIGPDEYMITKNKINKRRKLVNGVERDGGLFYYGPLSSMHVKRKAWDLSKEEFVRVEDDRTKLRRVVRGPQLFVPGEWDEVLGGKKVKAPVLEPTQYIIVHDTISGELSIVTGPTIWFPDDANPNAAYLMIQPQGPNRIRDAVQLTIDQHLHTKDSLTGLEEKVEGPCIYFPKNPYISVTRILSNIALKHNEYVRIEDRDTGAIRVERGEKTVRLQPTEIVFAADGGKKCTAIELDEDRAVLVRDTHAGHLFLKQGQELFIPGPYEEVVEPNRPKIRLLEHEVMILVNKRGEFEFARGDNKESREFFLPPYYQIKKLVWTTGMSIEADYETIERLDTRPQFMTYEFVARTSDNVELIIDVTFFWQVFDVEAMIGQTDDAPGDLCHHARSEILQVVSQVTFERFLAEFNQVVKKAIDGEKDDFYRKRGIKVHEVEVRRFECKDEKIELVLQQIISETTDRINQITQQESKNEVAIFKKKGEIDEEKLHGDLLKVKLEHKKMEAELQGAAEADAIKAFIESLQEVVPNVQDQIELYKLLRYDEALANQWKSLKVSQVYLTPDQLSLMHRTPDIAKPVTSDEPKVAKKKSAKDLLNQMALNGIK